MADQILIRPASVALDPSSSNFLCYLMFSGAHERSERLLRISFPRCWAGYETHWWESKKNLLHKL